MKHFTLRFALAAILFTSALHAQVPQLINYQGRVAVDAVNFEGTGLFKFALVNSDGSTTFWSNDGTSSATGSEPVGAVSLPVSKGLYSVLLGNIALANMTVIPAAVFANPDVRLRVWFDDGVNASQLLGPDQRLAPAAYVADGAINSSTIADGAIVAAKIAPAAINGTHLAAGSLDFSHLNVQTAPGAGQVLGFDGASLNWTVPGVGDGIWTLNPSNDAYFLGKVGIGTSTPANRLTVQTIGSSYGLEHTNGTVRLSTFTGGDTITAGWLGTISNHPLSFFVNNQSSSMTIATNGNVGIGTAGPQAKLHISHPTSVSHRIETGGGPNAWARVEFKTANGQWNIGTSRGFVGDQLYFAREGAAQVFSVQPNGDTFVAGTMSCKVLTIRGGADLAEPFQMKEDELDKGSVVVIDDEHPGRLKRSTHAYDTCVAGIISGANGINPGIALHQEGVVESGQNVALSGRVYVQADASSGAIKPGDLLTTSDTPGHAMKVNNHARSQGAVIGKAMGSLTQGGSSGKCVLNSRMEGKMWFIREVMAYMGKEVVGGVNEPEPFVSCVWSP